MRRMLFKSLVHGPLTEAGPGRGRRRAGGTCRAGQRGSPLAPWPDTLDPRSGRGFLQRLRARDPCAQQHRLRSRAFRSRFVASPRHADVLARDRPGHDEHARSARAHLSGDAGAEMGRRRRRLRARWGRLLRQLCVRRRSVDVLPVDLHIRGCPPSPTALLQGLIALVEQNSQTRHNST